jgi:hypothetical protein
MKSFLTILAVLLTTAQSQAYITIAELRNDSRHELTITDHGPASGSVYVSKGGHPLTPAEEADLNFSRRRKAFPEQINISAGAHVGPIYLFGIGTLKTGSGSFALAANINSLVINSEGMPIADGVLLHSF